jgi:hypothetical protein
MSMESLLLLGAVLIGAFIVFKIFGNLIKIVVLTAVAIAAVLYFTGGDVSSLPSINL